MRHGQMNEGNTGFWMQLVVLGQTTATPDPGKRAFYHPATGQDDKAFEIVTAFYYLQFPVALLLDPGEEFTSVTAIGPDAFEIGKTLLASGEYQLGSITILDVGTMHHHVQQQTLGVYEKMSLASFDMLACIIANSLFA